MKSRAILSPLLLVFLFLACGNPTQTVSFRPKGSSEPLWQLSVVKTGSGFELLHGDSLVCEAKGGLFAGTTREGRARYRGHDVMIHAEESYTTVNGQLLDHWLVEVFIDSELVTRTNF